MGQRDWELGLLDRLDTGFAGSIGHAELTGPPWTAGPPGPPEHAVPPGPAASSEPPGPARHPGLHEPMSEVLSI